MSLFVLKHKNVSCFYIETLLRISVLLRFFETKASCEEVKFDRKKDTSIPLRLRPF